ncbi:MAG: hypothetical protein AB1500_13040, partial [Bacillota bacterium]
SGGFTGAADVNTDLVRTYRHPTLYTSGKHSDTESYDNMPLANRHAECFDCHDPHRCDNTTAVAPAVYGSLKGVSGISINYNTASFDSWPGDATFTAKLGIDYQYELCFKCHSYYSYRNNPPDWPSRSGTGYKETDQAKEFSPNNPSYHAVVGDSKMTQTFEYPAGSGTYYHYGKFTGADRNGNPWSWNSKLYCTDCHGGYGSSVSGPHGSGETNGQKSILLGPYYRSATDKYWGTGGSTNNTADSLCYRCHDKAFYDGTAEGDGTVTVRSKFSNPAVCYNLHKYGGGHEKLACASCHSSIPHGIHQRGLLVTTADDVRYSVAGRIISFRSIPAPGNWSGSCNNCDTISLH